MMNLSAEDIAFIQSSYRDAKRKPSQRDTLKDLYPDVTPAEFAELTGTPAADWEGLVKKRDCPVAQKPKEQDRPAHELALDCMIFRSFDLLVELARERELPIETHWRDALNALESRLSSHLQQMIDHPATEEYELMIAAILTADDLDTKKKCPAGVPSQQSTQDK